MANGAFIPQYINIFKSSLHSIFASLDFFAYATLCYVQAKTIIRQTTPGGSQLLLEPVERQPIKLPS